MTSRARLSATQLPRLDAQLRPPIEPGQLRTRIVHLGLGAFHRAHQALYTEQAVAADGGDWGICGVTQRSPAVRDALAPQDGLYSVAVRDADGEQLRVAGAIREVLFAREQPDALTARIADPAVAIVTLTVTEKAYRRDESGRGLDLRDAEVAADQADGGSRTVVGQLIAGLARRRRDHGAPLTVLSCDNLPGNGPILAGLVGEFAQRRDPDLADWISAHVRFPATMVDRIVPATTAEDRAHIAARLGLEDQAAVITEPFTQWVIEDDFTGPRPAWERAGALLTADVAPYEQMKLRMLNGSHSLIAYLGQLSGHAYVADAVAAAGIRAAAEGLMTVDVPPDLDVPDGFDLDHYRGELLARFANPALHYRTAQVAMDGSQKLPMRLWATSADRRAAGQTPVFAALGLAAWMRVVSARLAEDGRAIPIDDPLAAAISERLAGSEDPGAVVGALLGMSEVAPAALAEDPPFRELLTDLLGRLAADGAERTAAAVAERSAA
ncbi:MAG TPA: mannitol dehydrogenase family protein [Solirubrobacteraceae bacterium]|nr:mannitol dehydrogenase family protein [Solirubrobacteraceae bacterium]